jgi:hypothetical protein
VLGIWFEQDCDEFEGDYRDQKRASGGADDECGGEQAD